MLTNQILDIVKSPETKTILEVGGHDDSESLELAKHFKKVFSYYEFVKIPEREEKNLVIKKIPYLQVLDRLGEFDVLLMENEFHHFPDVLQMQTYDKLTPNQELLIVEWDGRGNTNDFYKCFQNCRPLCEITFEVMNKFIGKKIVRLEQKVEGKYEQIINSEEELINVFKFMLPDHWKFGEKEFLESIKKVIYPFKMWEGYNIYKLKKI